MERLKSRKLWVTLAGLFTVLLNELLGLQIAPEVLASGAAMASAYVLGQGWVDSSAAKAQGQGELTAMQRLLRRVELRQTELQRSQDSLASEITRPVEGVEPAVAEAQGLEGQELDSLVREAMAQRDAALAAIAGCQSWSELARLWGDWPWKSHPPSWQRAYSSAVAKRLQELHEPETPGAEPSENQPEQAMGGDLGGDGQVRVQVQPGKQVWRDPADKEVTS